MTRDELIAAFGRLLAAAERAQEAMKACDGIETSAWADIAHHVTIARAQLDDALLPMPRHKLEATAVELDQHLSRGSRP